MKFPNHTMLDIRTLYASDPNRTGAHYLRRHRIRLLMDDPTKRNDVLVGTAIVEVAHLDEYISNSKAEPEELFDHDSEWQTISRLLYNYHDRTYHPEVMHKYDCLIWKPNIAFLRHIRLQPEFRGEGWGKEFLTLLRKHFAQSCGIMATFDEGSPKPAGLAHPLLPDHWERDEPFPQNRMLRGLKEAGFANVGKAHLFITDLQHMD
ncbi:MAG: hypothetical protein EP346_13580 [Bacteroidetes bacterium]|uniref:Uncharacterized protein n=1 Tax=Phaeocystidibacter marisrubri TaxID=1577780 RepID=A0A6L3ZHI9_9FLAO|nr:hypothetical protein [Phaeocystidibacter marisrubri]KAB2816469.1 hypothetical protein F8C82_12365 [Phaeocystidibacter marisrubri]TNE26732.1 MAG: hypothetical protein EP346_13580 [Bacteroidota bacterium]